MEGRERERERKGSICTVYHLLPKVPSIVSFWVVRIPITRFNKKNGMKDKENKKRKLQVIHKEISDHNASS